MRGSVDCFCTSAALRGEETWCPPCVARAFIQLRHDHPDTLSVGMATRRVPRIDGFTAAVAVELSRLALTSSVSHKARRNGRRDGARYVEHSPTDRERLGR